MMDERFTVRWFEVRSGNLNMLRWGYAVFDGKRRITTLWPTLEEAEAHKERIALIYARYGW